MLTAGIWCCYHVRSAEGTFSRLVLYRLLTYIHPPRYSRHWSLTVTILSLHILRSLSLQIMRLFFFKTLQVFVPIDFYFWLLSWVFLWSKIWLKWAVYMFDSKMPICAHYQLLSFSESHAYLPSFCSPKPSPFYDNAAWSWNICHLAQPTGGLKALCFGVVCLSMRACLHALTLWPAYCWLPGAWFTEYLTIILR